MSGGAVNEPWYASYFAPQWWEVAGYEYTAERTAAEVAYLASVLNEAPGRRVVDLGCGTGRHAVGLAALGFDVVGLDASAWAVASAQRHARAIPVTARFAEVDLLRSMAWPLPFAAADAAICVQSFGWGTDAQQERLLRAVRRHLLPGGVLILDHSSATAILRHHVPYAEFRADGLEADFHRAYRALTGRSAGRIDIRSAAGGDVQIYDDIRLYQPPEVRTLLERAGFTVERADADFAAGAPVTPDTRYVQFIARAPLATAPAPAIATWSGAAAPKPPPPEVLDLRWTPDEYDLVRTAVEAALDTVDSSEVMRRYSVTDPFGGTRAAETVARHFGVPVGPDMVTLGAGATGLLHSLALLSLPGPLLYAHGGHPDAPAWARRLGGSAVAVAAPDLAGGIADNGPAMVLLDRPAITGEFAEPAAVAELAHVAARHGAILVVDEAYATYAGPQASVVGLVPGHDNLIVVRSMSKGYCCGGLRAGFAVAAAPLTARLRDVATPLAVSETSMAACLALLDAADIFGALRDRVAAVKPLVSTRLRRAGCTVGEGSPVLPWVTVRAEPDVRDRLRSRGLLVKEPFDAGGTPWLKVALPLSPDRLARFEAALPAAPDPAGPDASGQDPSAPDAAGPGPAAPHASALDATADPPTAAGSTMVVR